MRILDFPILKSPKPWWQPFASLSITIFGISVLNWHTQPIVFLFWWEVILMLGASLIRMIFALDNQPFLHTFFQKIGLFFGGLIMGTALIMLTVTFTFAPFEGDLPDGAFDKMPGQIRTLIITYALGLGLHFFGNGRYKKAKPAAELSVSFFHILTILAILQVFTMHLFPKFPDWNQGFWAALALILIKFAVDLTFSNLKSIFK